MKNQYSPSTHPVSPGARWHCNVNGTLRVKLLGPRNGVVNSVVLDRPGASQRPPTVVRLSGAPPDGRCLHHLIRGWWKMSSSMNAAGISTYHFDVEADPAGGYLVSLRTPGVRSATARYVAKHGVKVFATPDDAPIWEGLAADLAAFLISYATDSDSPRERGADGRKLLPGFDEYASLRAQYLTR